jgi:polo-like kinase 1
LLAKPEKKNNLLDYFVQSMSELMKRRKTLTEPEVRYFILQLTSALTYLHDALIIHRDLKLGNIFLDSHMRVKVGDFGLATKLTHPDERKKTVCGTPNYIAPEILKGKTNGHSFEVDIWSTGIIIYTLLVGKPPYEAENVDATYRRILDNNYSFPSSCGVSDIARSLVQEILQLRPEARPSLLCIESNPFFTTPGLYTPSALSSAAMKEPPALCLAVPREGKMCTDGYSKAHGSHLPVNDENDPSAANRIRSQSGALPLHTASPPRKVLASSETEGFESGGVRSYMNRGRASSTSRGMPTRSTSNTVKSDRSESSGRIRKTRTSLSTSGENSATGLSVPRQRGLQPQRLAVQESAPVEKRGYTRQFEVYNDAKPAAATKPSVPVSEDISLKRPKASRVATRPIGGQRYTSAYDDETDASATESELVMQDRQATRSTDAVANRMEECEDEVVNEIQQNMEHFGIKSTDENRATPPAAAAAGAPKEVWAMEEEVDETTSNRRASNDEVRSRGRFATPTSSRPSQRHPDTLECMYKNLESSFAEQDSQGYGHVASVNDTADAPKVWVVRHVDYTSKYGLGFLLNTGSAGVYFNDSTKIVLSRDGNVFQYIERKRRASSAAVEHSVQTHTLSSFPPELTKKVTLLKHFKNYLVDQMQQSGTVSEAQMIFQQGIEAAAGHATLPCNVIDEMAASEGSDLPYVKKWVRTRHAILFRLSNRTVQVVFFDQRCVLLNNHIILNIFSFFFSVRSFCHRRLE